MTPRGISRTATRTGSRAMTGASMTVSTPVSSSEDPSQKRAPRMAATPNTIERIRVTTGEICMSDAPCWTVTEQILATLL